LTSGDEVPGDVWGRPIEDIPDDGIALFRATLDERLSNRDGQTE